MSSIMNRTYLVYFTAVFFSVMLTAWICSHETSINPDAICYLQSAATMHEGLKAVMNVCDQSKWPLYSIIIASFVKLAAISYVNAAHILDGVFSLLAVVAFIQCVALLSSGMYKESRTRLLWLAAGVILLANEFNSIKHYIVRDHGFWAFYLFSIASFLKFARTPQWYYAMTWSICIIFATLFRIEGAIFLLLAPFVIWFDKKTSLFSRMKHFLLLNAITIIAGLLIGFWLLTHPDASTGRLNEVFFQFTHGVQAIVHNFQLKTSNLSEYVLNIHSAKEASFILFLLFIVWYFASVISNLSIVYTALIIYAFCKKLLPADQLMRRILLCYIAINIIITLLFLFQNMFLSKRYLIALSLAFMLFVPFALENLIQKWPEKKWPLLLAMFVMIISSLGGIFQFGYSKQYIQDAGVWLKTNTKADSKIYSNDNLVMYYSERFGNTVFKKWDEYKDLGILENGGWKSFDYLAVRINQKKAETHYTKFNLEPVVVFANKRGDQVKIYQVE